MYLPLILCTRKITSNERETAQRPSRANDGRVLKGRPARLRVVT